MTSWSIMSQDVFKAPKAKRKPGSSESELWSPSKAKKRRSKEDFFNFCNIVLEYTNYEGMKQEELRANNTSPLDSTGSAAESFTSESTTSSTFSEETDLEERERLYYEGSSPSHLPDQFTPHQPTLYRNGSTNEEVSDEDSWELVTCFCGKPFAGRPMIECSECNTWIHLSCAKIRKSNIPEEFICQRCRDAKFTTRKSNRIRSEKKF